MTKLKIFTDGGARGNPGPAGCGFIIEDGKGQIVYQGKKFIGAATNNFAEYTAVFLALQKAAELKADEVEFFLDSELVVKQMKREYKVKNPQLAKIFVKIINLSQSFKKVAFIHVVREKNRLADKLVNEAIDESFFNA